MFFPSSPHCSWQQRQRLCKGTHTCRMLYVRLLDRRARYNICFNVYGSLRVVRRSPVRNILVGYPGLCLIPIPLENLSFATSLVRSTPNYLKRFSSTETILNVVCVGDGPVLDINSKDLACNQGGEKPAALIADATAGDTVKLTMSTWFCKLRMRYLMM